MSQGETQYGFVGAIMSAESSCESLRGYGRSVSAQEVPVYPKKSQALYPLLELLLPSDSAVASAAVSTNQPPPDSLSPLFL